MERLGLWWNSLRHQDAGQVAARARYELAWRLYPRVPGLVRAWCGSGGQPRTGFRWPAAAPPAAGHLGANRFRFLNEEADFGDAIDWDSPARSLLWRFHLHYFEWAEHAGRALLERHIESWIAANPPGSWPGWHPYPASLRVVNWIRAFRHGARAHWVESLAAQAAFVEGNLEFHLGGNHLLENARALLVAGLYVDGPRAARWRQTGLDLLRQQLGRQVLPDGGHCERSPYYHARMRRLVADVIAWIEAQGMAPPAELAEAEARMLVFERALSHPDGKLARFHDALEESDAEIDGASPPAAAAFPESGYYILEIPQGRLIADYGAPGDAPNPGHQHAGIFSFEASSGARRVIADSGTATYQAGPQRDRLRSTRAHNTVEVDGQDQFQVWDSFRVGRRARVRELVHRSQPGFEILSAAHDGYARLGVEHRRTIAAVGGAGWLIVDELAGAGSRAARSFLHLAPGISTVVEAGCICLEPVGWTVFPFGMTAAPKVIADECSPAVGVTEASQTLVFEAPVTLPCRFGYFLAVSPK